MITNKNSEEYQLIRTLLVCSFGIFNRLDALKYTTPHLLKKEYSDINLDLECKDFIIDYLAATKNKFRIKLILYLTTLSLFESNNVTWVRNEKINIITEDNKLLRQYLRKFNYLYNYLYTKAYPNRLSKLSSKKINMLAIKSLFLIHNLN